MRGADSIIERIKSVLLVVLFVSAVFFAARYIIGTQRMTISPSVNMPVDRLLVIRSGDSDTYAGELSEDELLPEFFAYRIGGTGGGLYANRDLMRDINRILSDYFANLFSGEAECRSIDRSDADSLWSEGLEGNYIYVKYAGELPYPLINAYHEESAGGVGAAASSDVVYADELLIVLTNDGSPEISQTAEAQSVYAISRSSSQCAIYTPAAGALEGIFYDTSLITAYNGNKSFVNYRFAGENDPGIKAGVPVTDDKISANVLEILRTDPVEFSENRTARNQMLRLFSYNPDNLSSYNDSESLVYVADHGSLRLFRNGSITYSASDERGGVELSNILGYGNYGGEYSIFETLRAACGVSGLISRIDPSLTGGAAGLQLREVKASGDGVTFVFSYFFNNIILLEQDGSSDALIVTIEKNKITELSLKTLSVSDTLTSEVLLPAKWVNENIYKAKDGEGELALAYIIESSAADGTAPDTDAGEDGTSADGMEPNNGAGESISSETARCGWVFKAAAPSDDR